MQNLRGDFWTRKKFIKTNAFKFIQTIGEKGLKEKWWGIQVVEKEVYEKKLPYL